MVKDLGIHPPNTLILDSVTFCVDFSKVSIEGGHPMGPVFAYGAARAVLSANDAERLVAAGVKDNRQIEMGRASWRIRICECLSNLANDNQMDGG